MIAIGFTRELVALPTIIENFTKKCAPDISPPPPPLYRKIHCIAAS